MDQIKPSCSNHHTDKYATGYRMHRSDETLDNNSESQSETVTESNIKHYEEDECILVTDDEELYTEEVCTEDIDMKPEMSDVDSETMSHISIPSSSEETTVDLCDLYNEMKAQTESASDTRPTSDGNKQETNEEIVKRVEQFLVSKGLLPAGTVNCKAIAQEIKYVTLNKVAKEYILLDRICEVYECRRYRPYANYFQQFINDISEEESSLPEKGCEQGNKLVDDSNLESKAKKSKHLDQKVPLTAGTSSEQKNRKEGAVDERPTRRVHTESTADDNLNPIKINKSKIKNIQECINPTQGPLCSSNKLLSVDSKATANRDFGKSGDTIPLLPAPVTSTKKSVSKEQNQPIKKQINTAMRTSSHEPSVDTKTSVKDKSGEGTPVLPKPVTNTKTLVSGKETQPPKKQINTVMRNSSDEPSLNDTNKTNDIIVLDESREGTPVLPKPVTSTKTILSEEQTQPVKKQITTAMRTSQGPLCSSHEPKSVDTKAGANSVLGKSGEGTPANIKEVVTQIQKKINNTRAGPIHQAQTHLTNKRTEVIDLTEDSDVQIVKVVSGTRPACKYVGTSLFEKYVRQLLASGINPSALLTNPVTNMIIPAWSSTSHMAPHSRTLMRESEVGLATMHTLPATIPTQRSPDTKASANNILGKSCESTSVLPKPVTNTKTLVSEEQTQPVKKQITTAMSTSQGPLSSSHEATLVDTIDLTRDGDLPIVEAVSGTIPVAKDTATANKAEDTILVGKNEMQIPASGTKPALTNPVKNMTTPAESHAGTSTDKASNSKIVKETSAAGLPAPCVLPGKRKRPAFTFAEPLIVGPPPSLSHDTHSNISHRVEENQMSKTPWGKLLLTPGNPQKKQ